MRDFHLPGRSTVFADNGMCATSNPLAAKVAVDILQSGGNAVDAAIAGAVLLGLCEPAMTGIGGDMFALIKKPGSDEVIALNGSGRAPKALSAADLRAEGHEKMPLFHPHAVTIPGAVDAFCRLSADHGVKGIDAALAPSIKYMRDGVPVSPRAAFDWDRNQTPFAGSAAQNYLVNGKRPAAGERFALPKNADVLERISKDGTKAFYEGEVAEDMVNSLRALGGTHELSDFAETQSTYGDPIAGDYKNVTLIEHAPNGQGATAILLNNILSHFDLAQMDPAGSLRAHIETEAGKLAYDARDRFLSDMDFMTRLDHMMDRTTGEKLAALIDPKAAMTNPRQLSEEVHKETIYITVVDKDRMMVSLIYSIFKDFGSGIASDKFGILFQNRGAGFNLEDGHPNEAAGGKRPMHTIIPAMLADSKGIRMPFGVMGGAYQPVGHARVVTNIVDFGMHPQAAIDAPRVFLEEGRLMIERGYPEAVHKELSDLGHDVVVRDTPVGGAQAIWIDPETGVLQGASDPRKDGCAIGY